MRRRTLILPTLTLLSCGLCLYCATSWIRNLPWAAGQYDGAFVFCCFFNSNATPYVRSEGTEPATIRVVMDRLDYTFAPSWRPSADFGRASATPAAPIFLWISLPDWTLAMAFGILPARWLYSCRRGKRRQTASLCPTCNYDLRATPDRCPECGTVPSAA